MTDEVNVILITIMSYNGQDGASFKEPYWGTENNEPPPDTPHCGFRREFCAKKEGNIHAHVHAQRPV